MIKLFTSILQHKYTSITKLRVHKYLCEAYTHMNLLCETVKTTEQFHMIIFIMQGTYKLL